MVWRASPDTGLGGTSGGSMDINLEISECIAAPFPSDTQRIKVQIDMEQLIGCFFHN